MRWFRRHRELSCQELVELLTGYLDGALPDPQQTRVAAHLAQCGHCRAYLAQLRTTIELTGRLQAQDVEPTAMDDLLAVFRDWKR